MNRQKTDSITHLVKIVASEVFDEKVVEWQEKKQQEKSLREWPTNNAGSSWVRIKISNYVKNFIILYVKWLKYTVVLMGL